MAGTVGGLSLTLVGHPLDTIKVRMQTMPLPAPGQAPMFSGMTDCIIKTARQEGLMAFYKGVSSPIVGIGAIYSLTFGVNSFMRKLLSPGDGQPLSLFRIGLAGAVAGSAAFVVTTPVELLKSRLQIQYGSGGAARYTGMIDCARQTIRESGLRGLYQGSVTTIMRDAPASFAWYGGYETTKRAITGGNPDEATPAVMLFSGGIGGICNWLVMYPIDVVKTRMQTAGPGVYSSVPNAFLVTYRELGIRGMLRGLSPCLARAFPANAACFLGYEYAMKAANYLW